jgi:hypothetical protein
MEMYKIMLLSIITIMELIVLFMVIEMLDRKKNQRRKKTRQLLDCGCPISKLCPKCKKGLMSAYRGYQHVYECPNPKCKALIWFDSMGGANDMTMEEPEK